PHSMLCCATLSLLTHMVTAGCFAKFSSATEKGTCLMQRATSFHQTTPTSSTKQFISTIFISRKECIVLTVTSARIHTAMEFCITSLAQRSKSIVKTVMVQFSNARRCLPPVLRLLQLPEPQRNDENLRTNL